MNECLLGFFFILLTISCKKIFCPFFFQCCGKSGENSKKTRKYFHM